MSKYDLPMWLFTGGVRPAVDCSTIHMKAHHLTVKGISNVSFTNQIIYNILKPL